MIEAKPGRLGGLLDVDRGIISREIFVNRNRVETETDLLVGKREDLLRRVDEGWRIARRKVILDQSVLLMKNLTFFF